VTVYRHSNTYSRGIEPGRLEAKTRSKSCLEHMLLVIHGEIKQALEYIVWVLDICRASLDDRLYCGGREAQRPMIEWLVEC
jgi:hypothetical protein